MDMQPYYCTSVVAYHTNWATWVDEQTFGRHLAQLHGVKTIRKFQSTVDVNVCIVSYYISFLALI
jgi:hypothetical protein